MSTPTTGPTAPPPSPEEIAQVRGITVGCIVGLTLGLSFLGLLILWLLNKRKSITIKGEEPELEGWKKWVVFFFKDLLIEIVSFVFGIYNIYQINTGQYGSVDINSLSIAFYIFFCLKFILVIYLICEDEVIAVKNFSIRVANTGWVPPKWAELAESYIFIPSIVIDGIFYNIDYHLYLTNAGDFTPYDSLAMMCFDTLLYLKFGILDALEAYCINYRYKVQAIFYCMSEFMYTLILVFMVIFINLCDLQDTGDIIPSRDFILVLVVALLHPILSRYTSMCLQGIKATNASKQLRSAVKARMAALNAYVRWFWFHPAMLLLNAAVYGVTFYLYISIWIVTASMSARVTVRSEAVIQGCIVGILILCNILTVFYMVNLSYAILKRMGVFFSRCCGFGCKYPLDCSTYAKAMNRGLQECNASFRMDTHMSCS